MENERKMICASCGRECEGISDFSPEYPNKSNRAISSCCRSEILMRGPEHYGEYEQVNGAVANRLIDETAKLKEEIQRKDQALKSTHHEIRIISDKILDAAKHFEPAARIIYSVLIEPKSEPGEPSSDYGSEWRKA